MGSKPKQINWWWKKLSWWLLVIWAIVTRFYRLGQPAELYFDEVYHFPASQLIAANDVRAYEWWHPLPASGNYWDWLHPPLAKLITAASLKIIGPTIWAGRFPAALFGTGLILLTVVVAGWWLPLATKNKILIATLAGWWLAVDGLVLVQSRLVMNDILLVFWLLLAWGSYVQWWRQWLAGHSLALNQSLAVRPAAAKKIFCWSTANRWLVATGIGLGLALATKWSALLIMGTNLIFGLGWLISRADWRRIPLLLISLIVIPSLIYVASYAQFFGLGKNRSDWWQLQQRIFSFQVQEVQNHQYASSPLEWVINRRPVWYWTASATDHQLANIYALANPVMIGLGLIALIWEGGQLIAEWQKSRRLTKKMASTVKLTQLAVDQQLTNTVKLLLRSLLLVNYFGCWGPWLLSPRPMFFYHYLPALPLIAISGAEFSGWLKQKNQWLFWGSLLLLALAFILFYPHWTGLPAAQILSDQLYFRWPNWR